MLVEIRLYIMQILVAMNKITFSLEDIITPNIRKREWIVFPSGFQELKVRKGDQSYGVSLQHKWLCGIGDAGGSGIGDSGSGGRCGGRTGERDRRGGGRVGRGGGRGSRGGGRAGEGGGMAGSISLGVLPAKETEESIKEAPLNQQYHEVFIPSIHSQPTQQSGVWFVDTTVTIVDFKEAPVMEANDTTEVGEGKAPAVDKGKAKASVKDEPAPKRKRGRPPSNFDEFGTGSTPDKAFDVEDYSFA
nr:hypothetical protein [Tanacetum cinerariifolium]GEY70336.1 hypothetical protein [Tanacetum cinerariifolium]